MKMSSIHCHFRRNVHNVNDLDLDRQHTSLQVNI